MGILSRLLVWRAERRQAREATARAMQQMRADEPPQSQGETVNNAFAVSVRSFERRGDRRPPDPHGGRDPRRSSRRVSRHSHRREERSHILGRARRGSDSRLDLLVGRLCAVAIRAVHSAANDSPHKWCLTPSRCQTLFNSRAFLTSARSARHNWCLTPSRCLTPFSSRVALLTSARSARFLSLTAGILSAGWVRRYHEHDVVDCGSDRRARSCSAARTFLRGRCGAPGRLHAAP